MAVLGVRLAGGVGRDVGGQGGRGGHHRLEGLLAQRQGDDRRHRLGGEVPRVLVLEQGLVGEVLAVGQGAQHRVLAVLADADLVDLAVGDEADRVRRLAPGHDDVAHAVLALDEAPGQGGQHLVVVEAAQPGQLPQLLGHDPDLGPGGDERQPPVAHRVGEAAVDPVAATGDLDPGQHPQQPAGGDLLHLGRGLGGRGQVGRRLRRQAHLVAVGTGAVVPVLGRQVDQGRVTHRCSSSPQRIGKNVSLWLMVCGAEGNRRSSTNGMWPHPDARSPGTYKAVSEVVTRNAVVLTAHLAGDLRKTVRRL